MAVYGATHRLSTQTSARSGKQSPRGRNPHVAGFGATIRQSASMSQCGRSVLMLAMAANATYTQTPTTMADLMGEDLGS